MNEILIISLGLAVVMALVVGTPLMLLWHSATKSKREKQYRQRFKMTEAEEGIILAGYISLIGHQAIASDFIDYDVM